KPVPTPACTRQGIPEPQCRNTCRPLCERPTNDPAPGQIPDRLPRPPGPETGCPNPATDPEQSPRLKRPACFSDPPPRRPASGGQRPSPADGPSSARGDCA